MASGGEVIWTVAAAALAIVGPLAVRTRPGRVEPAETSAEGLPAGAPAPDFELPSLGGGSVSLAALLARGRPLLIVFSDPGCGPCIALAPRLAEWQRRHPRELTIAVVERADGQGADSLHDEHGRRNVLLDRDRQVAGTYGAAGTPSGVLISTDGRVASEVAGGGPAIESLRGRAPRFRAKRSGGAWLRTPSPRSAGVAHRWGRDCGGHRGPAERPGVNTDAEHCGRCDRTCPPGESCCEGACRRLDSDPRNCGACGQRCAEGEVCSEGRCRRRFRRGLRNCDGECVDAATDQRHCGRCGTSCEGYDCCNGKCCGYNAALCCPGGCVNPSFDDQNCGGCGIVCGPNSYCRFGTCTCPVPPCP